MTFIVALSSGVIFNINPYLPMILCILICIIANIIYFFMKDVSNNDITSYTCKKIKKIKISKIFFIILINYAIFYGIITPGQQNSKLLIQYELSDLYNTTKVSLALAIAEIIISFKLYKMLKNNIYTN